MNNERNYYTMTDEEQDKLYPLSKEEKEKWQKWVPNGYKITNMQIYDAKERGISIPTGNKEQDQEYIQFLAEHTLKTVEKNKKQNKKRTWEFNLGWNYLFRRRKKSSKTDNKVDEEKQNNNLLDIENKRKEIDEKEIKEKLEQIINDTKIEKNKLEEKEEDKKIEEINIKLDEYIQEIEKELEKEEENYLVKITERNKSFVIPLIITMITAMLISGISIEDKIVRETVKQEMINKILTYELKEHITYDEALEIAMENIKIGDEYQLSNGQKFNTNSLGTGTVTKELGKEFDAENKFEGKYPITGFSIIRNSDNQMLAYIEDFYAQTRNDNLKIFVDETLKDTNLDYDDIRVEFHFGRTDSKTGERSRLGWIEDNNVVLNEDEIQKIINDSATYQGSIENFNGSHITIDTKDGKVRIPIKDENGNYYSSGKVVEGSDDKKYEISSLVEDEKTEVVEETKEIIDGKKISFDIKDCNLLAGAPFALLALTEYLRKKKMNEKAEKNPYYKIIEKDEKEEYTENFNNTNSKIGKIHEGMIYSEKEFNQKNEILKQAYYEKTGIYVNDTNQIIYMTHNGRFMILNKENPDQMYDITDYITEYLETGNSIGSGWDKEAEEYFEEMNGSKGRRGGR